ncbi:hypothetical protein [Azorhizobium sp. AG788]|uniref:hypothetical protein n=1 Tax=Azorhizobium sp. AG788 TaxID=2183897 RepID=UPI003138CC0B
MASRTNKTSATPAPIHAADGIITGLGREIGRAAAECASLEARGFRSADPVAKTYFENASTHAGDRLFEARQCLSSLCAASLSAAAIQCAAAYALLGDLGDTLDPFDTMKRRALERLLASVSGVLTAAAAQEDPDWAETHGVTHLLGHHTDPWQDVDSRINVARG